MNANIWLYGTSVQYRGCMRESFQFQERLQWDHEYICYAIDGDWFKDFSFDQNRGKLDIKVLVLTAQTAYNCVCISPFHISHFIFRKWQKWTISTSVGTNDWWLIPSLPVMILLCGEWFHEILNQRRKDI